MQWYHLYKLDENLEARAKRTIVLYAVFVNSGHRVTATDSAATMAPTQSDLPVIDMQPL